MSGNWLDDMMAGRGEPPPHIRSLKLDTLTLVKWEEGAVDCTWALLPEHCTGMGFAFGGYLACVVDAVAVFTMATLPGDWVEWTHVTQDMRLTYFRPMPAGDGYTVEGRIVNRTKSSAFIEITVRTPDGKLAVKSSMIEQIRAKT